MPNLPGISILLTMFRSFLLLLSGFVLTLSATQAAPLLGRMDGDFYVSANSEFRLRPPVLPELGGIIEDTATTVTFHDDFGTHVSIACIELDATQRWELSTRGLRDYLLYVFTDLVMGNFSSRYPGSSIESARYLPELLEGSLIAFSLLPGGSQFEQINRVPGTPAENPVTAKRGTLLFVRHRHVYVVSAELAERATQRSTYQLTTAQEDAQLATRLTGLVERLVFTRDRPRVP